MAVKPDASVLAGLDVGVVGPRGKVGVIGSRAPDEAIAFEVRAFFPGNNGMTEDPVTGQPECGVGAVVDWGWVGAFFTTWPVKGQLLAVLGVCLSSSLVLISGLAAGL